VKVGKKLVRMKLPEGLLEVNAPLTPEEKLEQSSRADSENGNAASFASED
jgi:hypothetical protein